MNENVRAALCGVPAVVKTAAEGGATCVQLREKSLAMRRFVEVPRAIEGLVRAARRASDHQGAARCGADGPPQDVDRLLPGAP